MFPSPIKLEIPGWAGSENKHTDGDKPQPWHCPPFVEGSTYGLELIYPFDTECHVKNINGQIVFEGDFSEEQKLVPATKLPPFLSFAPGHFGMTSALDIKVPEQYVLRTEPHPSFFTDQTGTFPCCITGHIQTYWWPKFFFVVFKNPPVGGEVIFKKNTPYGQIIVVPKKPNYVVEAMTKEETAERSIMDYAIDNNISKIAKNSWRDHKGNPFSDKYKQLSSLFTKEGYEGVKSFLTSLYSKRIERKKCPLFIRKKK